MASFNPFHSRRRRPCNQQTRTIPAICRLLHRGRERVEGTCFSIVSARVNSRIFIMNSQCETTMNQENSEFEKKLRLGLFQCETSLSCKGNDKSKEKCDSQSSSNGSSPEEQVFEGINSMDLSRDGNYLAVAVNCDSVAFINLNTWRESNFPVKKYGIGAIKFFTNRQAIHTSTKVNNALRLIDFDKPNEYVRFFRLHEGSVSKIDTSRNGKNVISSSADDRSVALWDISRDKAIGTIEIPTVDSVERQSENLTNGYHPRQVTSPRPVVSFDPTGYFFALAMSGDPATLRLFDLRCYSRGPFLSSRLDLHELINGSLGDTEDESSLVAASCSLGADFTEISFSPDAKTLLINTDGPLFYSLCASTGQIRLPILRSYHDYKLTYLNDTKSHPQVIYSPDSKYFLGGSGLPDGRIHIWNASTGVEVNTIKQVRDARNEDLQVNYIAHHPCRMKIITSGLHNIDIYRPLHLKV